MAHPRVADDEIFQIDGRPAQFHLFTAGFGALTAGQVDALEAKITTHGGEFTEIEEEADIIIVQYVGLEPLRRKYWDSRTVWVEEPAFIQICINSGKCAENLQKPMRRGMGGQPTGKSRIPFTAEDDQHLARYLASVIPDAGEGGRGGIEIYKRLVASADEFERRQWVRRHTMWSWRERYNKRKHVFDPIIEQLVAENPPRPDGKGLYERSRYFPQGRRLGSDEEDEFEEEGDGNAIRERAGSGEDQQAEQPAPRRRQSEPDVRRRRNEGMDAPPHKRARYTEVPQRRMSSVERARSMQRHRSSSYVVPEENIPFEVSSAEEDDDIEIVQYQDTFDVDLSNDRPGPEDAGPSGTQRSPPPPSTSRTQTSSPVKKRRAPAKPQSRTTQDVAKTNTARPDSSQAPMSSQATLVGATSQKSQQRPVPPPSIYNGPTPVAQEEEETSEEAIAVTVARSSRQQRSIPLRSIAEDSLRVLWPQETTRRAPARELRQPAIVVQREVGRAGKGKRIGVVPNSAVGNPPQVEALRSAPSGNSAIVSKPGLDAGVAAGPSGQQQVDRDLSYEEDFQRTSQRTPAHVDMEQPGISAKTEEGHEDDRYVEEMLVLSHGASMDSATSKHPFEEDLDSDDERARRTLLPGSAAHNRSLDASRSFGLNTSATNRFFGSQLPMYDADLDGEASKSATRAPGVHPSSTQRSPAGRPSSSRPLLAAPVPPADLDRTTSLGSETDTIPMLGTRARQEKSRLREQLKQTPYTPPSGTRAAQAAGTLELRNRQVSRPVQKTARR